MGLDMYLLGEKFFWTDWENPENDRKEDDKKISSLLVDIGYWRKHPDLHGYIVQTFADGVDECQKIELCVEDIEVMLEAVKNDQLIQTEGFFFGKSGDKKSEDKQEAKWAQRQYDETLKILSEAIEWVNNKEKGVSRSLIYRASW